MATQFERIDARLKDFISRQHIFFTASATNSSRVNISQFGRLPGQDWEW